MMVFSCEGHKHIEKLLFSKVLNNDSFARSVSARAFFMPFLSCEAAGSPHLGGLISDCSRESGAKYIFQEVENWKS